MKITYINSQNIKKKYLSDYTTYKAYEELEKFYGPYELFTKVSTYFRSNNELPSYIGKGVYSNIDYIIQKVNNKMSFSPNLSQSLFGGGKGDNYSKILISTLGEMFERIIGALAYYTDKDNLIFGSYKDLSKQFNLISPDKIKLFAPEQIEKEKVFYNNFTEDSKVRWVKGTYLNKNTEIWVPAQLVYIFYPFEVHGECKIGYSTSGGLSLHDNKELALYHGITECIERDQINLRWYNKLPPENIQYENLENKSIYSKKIIEEAQKTDKVITSQYHNIDMHEFPVVTTVSYNDDLEKFSFCAGGGVGSSIEDAVESSFKEYGQSELNLKSLFYNPNWYSSKSMIELFGFEDFDIDNMKLFYEIVPFYGLSKNKNKLNWYLYDGKVYDSKKMIRENKNNFFELKKLLLKYNIDPIIFDFTPLDFNHIKLMKSYIPELTQAFLPNSPCLGHPRFYKAAFENKYIDRELKFSDLNTEPLPFP
ncbi:YcaO-like family protein [Macrococcus capreoli]|uniref:YcaO-like family protein n=1 Tax=Macrococcus capreoli TaxID=2982690 RepID=UPI0021D5AB6F|nr:YcaO-like family protein [Macrococcus sp. TMW 2.2395]MCU7558630.1 YcaO-like family protein [Macrococcus sp. TMW 2.2395]